MDGIWQDSEFVNWYNDKLRLEKGEMEAFLAPLALGGGDVLVDFGCGDGSLLEYASPLVRIAVGVDGSLPQIEAARERLKGRENVRLLHHDLLACDLSGFRFTRGVSRKTLHHLTDDEKLQFMQRVSPCFAPGALFALEDMIFDFPKEALALERLLGEAAAFYGSRWDAIRDAFVRTLREEHPADLATWRSVLASGGFTVVNMAFRASFYGNLVARKESESIRLPYSAV